MIGNMRLVTSASRTLATWNASLDTSICKWVVLRKLTVLLQTQAYIYCQRFTSWWHRHRHRHRHIGAWMANRTTNISVIKNRYSSIYLPIFDVTYVTNGMLLNVGVTECKENSVCTGNFKQFLSCFCFLNYLAVAKMLNTICQLKARQDLVE